MTISMSTDLPVARSLLMHDQKNKPQQWIGPPGARLCSRGSFVSGIGYVLTAAVGPEWLPMAHENLNSSSEQSGYTTRQTVSSGQLLFVCVPPAANSLQSISRPHCIEIVYCRKLRFAIPASLTPVDYTTLDPGGSSMSQGKP